MFLTSDRSAILQAFTARAGELGRGASRVYVSGSGGVDSSVVAGVLVLAFGADNTVVLFRDVRSKPEHREDIQELQAALGFRLIELDLTVEYDSLVGKMKQAFEAAGEHWCSENSGAPGWDNAYACFKSRLTTPLAGFVSKAVDGGRGRVFGTGNAEEDMLLRYYDKYGDGAVDNNLLNGLTKCEVRQLALHLAEVFKARVYERIARKLPSADLWGRGNEHNDEDELSGWARDLGYDIRLSYGDTENEGNIAWALKEDLARGVISGCRSDWSGQQMARAFGYTKERADLVLFLRQIECATRHKDLGLPGFPRQELQARGLVD